MAKRKNEMAEALIIQALKELKKPSTFSKIARYLTGTGIKRSQIEKSLRTLVKKGEIVKLKDNRYQLKYQAAFVTGIFEANIRGFGFLLSEDGDVFIPQSGRGGALNRDLCLAVVTGIRRGKREGRIVRVVNRAISEIVGVVERKGKYSLIVPVDRRIDRVVFVTGCQDCEVGDVIVAKITGYPESSNDPIYARFEKKIGREGDKGIDIEIIIRMHQLPLDFPEEVVAEARKVSVLPADEIKRRKDLRSLFTVTIDGLNAKDFDDAVSCVREGNNFRLWVHIADVSFYVSPNSFIDREARERAFSVYLVDRVIPMLPFELSAGICSLKPEEDRLALTVEMLIDSMGEVLEYSIYESVIRSNFRLTYEEVDEGFEKGGFEVKEVENLMFLMKELSEILEAKRLKRGALNFEIPEAKVILDSEGNPVDIIIRQKTPATSIIEEAMIVTNETIASHLYWNNYPCIYRVHESPDENDLIFVERFLAELGYPHDEIRTGHSRALQKVIRFAEKRPEKVLVNSLLLRAMKQARYSPSAIGHFGLASQLYAHFTSPIRRYPDLVVHRLVKESLKRKSRSRKGRLTALAKQIEKELSAIAEHCSVREREVDASERDSQELKLYELIKRDYIGEVFEGIISGITQGGIFVELPNTAEGFIPFANIMDDYYEVYTEKFEAVGKKTKKVFRVGERIMVQVVSVLVSERRIELRIV